MIKESHEEARSGTKTRDKIQSKSSRLSTGKVKGYQPRARTSCRRKERASEVAES